MNLCLVGYRFGRWLVRAMCCLGVGPPLLPTQSPTSPPLTPKPTIEIPPDDRISYARKMVERHTRSHTRFVYEDPLWIPPKIPLNPPTSTPQNFHPAMYA